MEVNSLPDKQPDPTTGASATPTQAGVLANQSSSTDFNFTSAAGNMAGPTSYQPSQNSLVSSQLQSLLNKDSDYMRLARTKALQQVNARGLSNSSMAVGAAQAANIEAARPIAEGDANAYFTAERDNNQTTNQFSRDSNQFGREAAGMQYRGILDRESQGRDQSFRAGESALEREQRLTEMDRDQGFRAGESALERGQRLTEIGLDHQFRGGEADEDRAFRSGESALDRSQRLTEIGLDQDFRAGESAMDRTQRLTEIGLDQGFRAGESEKDRDFRIQEATTAFSRELERMGFQNNLNNQNIPIQFASNLASNLQTQVATIMSDPNMDVTAKENAVKNLVNYSNSTMEWAGRFYGGHFSRFSATEQPSTPGAHAPYPNAPTGGTATVPTTPDRMTALAAPAPAPETWVPAAPARRTRTPGGRTKRLPRPSGGSKREHRNSVRGESGRGG
jgi:hypothetical protein